MKGKILGAALTALLFTTSADADILWMTGWDSAAGHGKLHGFDAVTGELVHTVDGYDVSAVDVCDETGTAFFLDGTTLKSIDEDGTVSVVDEFSNAVFYGMPQVFVGQRHCTVWVLQLGSTEMFIIRNAGTPDQYRIDTEAFDTIHTADIDDSNDDLWIGQYNQRIYRVSKKTGLRSYRIEPAGDIGHLRVDSGRVHVMRHGELTGYSNETRRENQKVLYVDTSHRDLLNDHPFSFAYVETNGLGDPVIRTINPTGGAIPAMNELMRMEIDTENSELDWTADHFITFEDMLDIDPTASGIRAMQPDGDGNYWLANSSHVRLYHPSGAILRQLNYGELVPDFNPNEIAY